jgi:hypothetical protein
MDIENPYSPPAAAVSQTVVAPKNLFYVVSPAKFWTLFLMTFSTYSIYWVYKHWANWKVKRKENIWPVMRTIFSIFFYHSLADEIDKEILIQRVAYQWSGRMWATLAVILIIIERILSRVTDDNTPPILDLLLVLTVPTMGYFLYQFQCAANAACLDEEGVTNSKFTAANIVWCVLGGMFWVLVILGLFVIATES